MSPATPLCSRRRRAGLRQHRYLQLAAVLLITGASLAGANPIINEIFYHEDRGTNPENPLTEWIELHNPTPTPISIAGWSLVRGVSFTFPAGTSIPGNGFIVVAADLPTFNTDHPGVDNGSNVFSPWIGRLRNSGESIELADAAGTRMDLVRYADEGDWAQRARGPVDRGHEGWTWSALHDGGGHSLELINPALSNNRGQNWDTSTGPGGTPGTANSVASTAVAPLLLNVRHEPSIPSSSDSVTVTTELEHETLNQFAVLYWRPDGQAGFDSMNMLDNGQGGLSAIIPPHPDGTVIEFYVWTTNGNEERTWPGSTQPSGDQDANALFQIDDSFDPAVLWVPGTQPKYRVIMTEVERAELEDIGDGSNSPSGEDESNAEMNCTFIAEDGTGVAVHYVASIRNRGASSRSPPPNNFLVKFRSDDDWGGRSSIKFNARYGHSQVFGSWYYRRMGVETADAAAARLCINGADLSESGSRMFGSYARVESFGSEFSQNHWPLDDDGNFYQVRDDEATGEEGDLRYEGTDPNDYRDTYFKQTNEAEDDWSDLIALTDALNNAPAATYVQDLEQVLNVDQWLAYFAVDTLAANLEGGLITGKGDDYGLYRGKNDPRFLLVPHDLDTLFNMGVSTVSPNRSIFTFDGLAGLGRFFDNDEIVQRYYAKLLDLVQGDFSEAVIHPMLDELLGDYVSQGQLDDAREWTSDRTGGVLAQIPQNFSATTNLTPSDGYHRTTTGGGTFSGDFPAAKCLSVQVGGREATRDQRDGTWQLQVVPADNFFKPGLNRVSVQCFSGAGGTGTLVAAQFVDVWFDTGSTTNVSGTLTGQVPSGNLRMVVRDSYLPSTPVLVRLEMRNPDGTLNRNLWDATATLSSNVPGVTLSPDTVTMRNGLGSALVTIAGGSGGTPETLLPLGSVWKYLDDGSNQGTAWRAPAFNDGAWDSGPAQLGYGDGDEDTTVGFVGGNNSKNATTYFRTTFNVADAGAISTLTLNLLYDDGAAIYLNGVEIAKTSNMTSDLAFNEYSDGDSPQDDATAQFTGISPALLVTGTNTLAVEIKQGDGGSSDISFDLEVIGTSLGTDPGDVTLTANAVGQQVSKPLTSLDGQAVTTVSGTLPGASTTWNGIVHLTGDLTVPTGHLLTVNPGTLILIDGDATSQSTTGADLIVQGAISASGTEASPITFTAFDSSAPWGQILFDNAESANFAFANIHRAGHSPRGGHTGHGRVLRIRGSTVTFDNCNVTDNRGKIGESDAQGGSDSEMTFRECHWARSVMGIETFDTQVLMEDSYITDMLGQYREDGTTDDDDAIYLHGAGSGQTLVLRRLIVANCDDDGIDTLGAENVVIEDCISRDVFDKGVSMLGGSATVTRSLFTNCDIGFSAKNDADVVMDFCTITGNASIGVQAENKTGSDARSFYTISNSILWNNVDEVRTDYAPGDIVIRHSLIAQPWPDAPGQHASNINGDPLFVNASASDFHLTAASPAKDAADPALPQDGDGTNQDLGRYPYDPVFDGAGSEIRWAAANGPYRVTSDVTIPAGANFVIEPGTNVYFEPGTRIEVRGSVQIEGTPTMRVQLSSVPGASHVPDPASGGLPDGPPKWDGIKIIDSMDPTNRIAHLDVRNAQHNQGAIGIIRSQCVIDDVTFSGTHIRMIYTDDASVIIENSVFPDMFAPNEQAAALGLDNVSEHIKGDGTIPAGGRYIIRNNRFGTNKGHNDVVDVVSGRRPDPIVQILGNHFSGSRDEELDLGGDLLIEANVFTNVFKDDETSDRGYANGISTGDFGADTTNVLARNIFWDVDHAINLKRDSATIFEYNTVFKVHPDFVDNFNNTNIGSVINFFVPGDTSPTAGAGAYAAGNIFTDIPRVFGNADQLTENTTFTTPLELHDNLIDPAITDITVGPEHPGQSIFDLGANNSSALPLFADPDNGDFSLLPGSPALGAGPLGADLGALTAPGIQVTGEPPALTSSNSATLTVGGPGIFGYRYRINAGPWSADMPIGNANGYDPNNVTVRTAQIQLTGLADGAYTVFVEGRNFAGDWAGTPTASSTWTVDSSLSRLVINEVLADNSGAFNHLGTFPDIIEICNFGAGLATLSGMSISDDPADPTKFVFPPNTFLASGACLILYADDLSGAAGIHVGFSLSAAGEGVYLYSTPGNGGALVDSIEFGPQVPGLSIGRINENDDWTLNVPTPGGPNVSQPTGNARTLVLNEWLTSGDVLYGDDWFEIYNPDPLPVALAGLSVTDHPGDPTQHIFPPLTFIAGNGFLKLIADRNPAAGKDHVPFSLDADQDRLALFASDLTLIDEVLFGPQSADVSQGRWAASSTGLDYFTFPTGGLDNSQEGNSTIPGFDNALDLLRYLRITELMYEPNGGTIYEFVELRNIGPVTLDLTGVRFTDGISFVFPPILLGPGEEVLVVGDFAAFTSRYGAGLNVAGVYGGSLNNRGEDVVLSLPLPFDAAIHRFAYFEEWYPATAGPGFSLELRDDTILPRDYDLAASWQASNAINGSPDGGTILIPTDFPGWLAFYALTALQDGDGDGLVALVEFALGLDPTLDLGANGPVSLPVLSLTPDKRAVMSFFLPVNPSATDGFGAPDIVYTIEASTNLVGWTVLTRKTDSTSFTGPGTVTAAPPFNGRVFLEITDNLTALERRFLRLKMEYVPGP